MREGNYGRPAGNSAYPCLPHGLNNTIGSVCEGCLVLPEFHGCQEHLYEIAEETLCVKLVLARLQKAHSSVIHRETRLVASMRNKRLQVNQNRVLLQELLGNLAPIRARVRPSLN